MMYSIPLGENGDHFLVQKIILAHVRILYDILKTTTAYNKEAGIISPTTFSTGATNSPLDSSSDNNVYDGRIGARDEPDAEAFAQ
jgi:hypothetical protein